MDKVVRMMYRTLEPFRCSDHPQVPIHCTDERHFFSSPLADELAKNSILNERFVLALLSCNVVIELYLSHIIVRQINL